MNDNFGIPILISELNVSSYTFLSQDMRMSRESDHSLASGSAHPSAGLHCREDGRRAPLSL